MKTFKEFTETFLNEYKNWWEYTETQDWINDYTIQLSKEKQKFNDKGMINLSKLILDYKKALDEELKDTIDTLDSLKSQYINLVNTDKLLVDAIIETKSPYLAFYGLGNHYNTLKGREGVPKEYKKKIEDIVKKIQNLDSKEFKENIDKL